MPGGDGTGPRGMGPMTGRAAGYCAGYSRPGFTNPVPRMGLGLGRYPYPNPTPMRPYYGMGFFGGRGGGRGRGFRCWR
ncbi:MAG: hypothetical protein E3J87_00110 [Candidatus Cloacimonadota bacterium]|nr:MAG: hypothetical protein E3J87_00110 [Candidatus Cloacimonadota bacterium]